MADEKFKPLEMGKDVEDTMWTIREYLNKCDTMEKLMVLWDFGMEVKAVAHSKMMLLAKKEDENHG